MLFSPTILVRGIPGIFSKQILEDLSNGTIISNCYLSCLKDVWPVEIECRMSEDNEWTYLLSNDTRRKLLKYIADNKKNPQRIDAFIDRFGNVLIK